MSKLFLHQHLGLGDQIMCNAITRKYALEYDDIYLYVKKKNYSTVSFMFRDLKNIKYIILDFEENEFAYHNELQLINGYKAIHTNAVHLDVGFSNFNINRDMYLDEQFFYLANVDFSTRFKNYYVKRDMEREMFLFDKLKLTPKSYILICNQTSVGFFHIDHEKYTKFPNAKVIFTDIITDNMFDWLYTAENALEIYAVESAFRLMIDNLKLEMPLFFKTKKEGEKSWFPSTQNNWKQID